MNKTMIVNCTAHPVCIISRNDAVRKLDVRKYIMENKKAEAILVFPKGTPLNVTFEDAVAFKDGDLEVVKRVATRIDPLPKNGDYFIVSQMYANACRVMGLDTKKLLCVGEPVYATPDGKQPIGVLNLQTA